MGFTKIEKFIKENSPNSLDHSERAAYWVKKLDPKATEAMVIAAYLHDIERAFRKESTREITRVHGFDHPEYLRIHQEEGAEIASQYLGKEGYSDSLIGKVKELIIHHEVGGTDNENTLMDADTISFFETKIPSFTEQLKQGKISQEQVEKKIGFMLNRIKSEEAKEICENLCKKFRKALKDI